VSSRSSVQPLAAVARPLRHVYPRTGSPGLPPVDLLPIQTSRLHLPAPLGSTGITRLHRYYECSDSYAWVGLWLTQPGTHPLLVAAQVSPRHGPHLPSSPSPITSPPPPIALAPVLSASEFPFITGLGFTFPSEARQSARPNRVCATTDGPFASRCSPPHLAVTQLRSATERKQVILKGTFTSLM
jgi:hypothetical protein